MNILITGASRGIGFETAKAFCCEKGNRVFAVSRNVEGLNRLKAACVFPDTDSILVPVVFDLLSGALDKLVETIKIHVSEIDVLVNNAGVLVNRPFAKLSETDFDQLFNVNVKSAFLLTQSIVPLMPSGAHIVNVGSMGGVQGSSKFSGLSLYSASKGALAILSECLAEELKPQKISVNCLAMGSVQTEMLRAAFPGYEAGVSAEEMGRYIKDFAIHGNTYYNGKVLPVSVTTP